ncbi:MAG TPA: tRNA-dihydrouridine synthase family protein [Paludibacteraceae bacterium]|nr:tRNA-dihydrouridine synthase family protein [Paludibacteraceae bacterium]
MKYKILFAPLQGCTDYCYRNAFEQVFGGVDSYYTPFLRIERKEIRTRDIVGIKPENNHVPSLIPQILADTKEDFEQLMSVVLENGYKRVDINLGCPFPLITNKQKGSGMLPFPEKVEAMLSSVADYSDVTFSVKMRLGMSSPDECLALLPLFEKAGISQISMHARLGSQQYKGNVDMDAFARFYDACSLPLIYNGDICTVEDIERITTRFPKLAGVMIGRGLLAHPELAMEYKQDVHLSDDERMEKYHQLHDLVFEAYRERLKGGDAQVVSKMKDFWEYFYPEMDKKSRKAIKKAITIAKYENAVML